MPKELHDRLKKQAAEKGLTGERAAAYIYGTLERIKSASRSATGVVKPSKKPSRRGGGRGGVPLGRRK